MLIGVAQAPPKCAGPPAHAAARRSQSNLCCAGTTVDQHKTQYNFVLAKQGASAAAILFCLVRLGQIWPAFERLREQQNYTNCGTFIQRHTIISPKRRSKCSGCRGIKSVVNTAIPGPKIQIFKVSLQLKAERHLIGHFNAQTEKLSLVSRGS